MTSSWDTYYIVFLSALLSLGIPGGLAAISFICFSKNKKINKQTKLQPGKPNRTILGQRINVRFFLAANASLILITLGLELIPCATTLHSAPNDGLLEGLIAIVSLAGFSVLGLLYSARKGDLGWLSSFYNELQKEKKSE